MTEIDLEEINKAKLVKTRIKLVLIILILLAVGGSLFIFKPSNQETAATHQNTEVGAGSHALNIDKVWRHKLEENLEDQNVSLNDKIEEIKAELLDANKQVEEAKDKEIAGLREKLKFLEIEFGASKNQDQQVELNLPEQLPRINRYNLMLSNPKNSKDYKPLKMADNYIAAGSFVKGILLSGVDVSTSIKTANDPEPVLIRLIDYGTLPRKFKSDVKDCHIIGSSYGDLSSERAKIRVEKLSCTEIATSEIIETEISGYVSGEDGRAGLRGIVVSIDQKYLANAQIFGTLGGIAKSAVPEPQVINPFLGITKQASVSDKIGNNVVNGAGSSLDKLADYYIDRAEAIQPVIQVAAGRAVDVIFTEGVYFGTTHLKSAISKKREERLKSSVEHESNLLVNQMENR